MSNNMYRSRLHTVTRFANHPILLLWKCDIFSPSSY